jgi:hypothetical protein
LEYNVARNSLDGVDLHRCTLWDAEAELDFYTEKHTPGQLFMSVVHGHTNDLKTKITVPAIGLSRFLDTIIDSLKMHVEVAEEQILSDLEREGACECILQTAIEYHRPHHVESSRLGHVLAMLERKSFGLRGLCRPAATRAQIPIRRRNGSFITPELNRKCNLVPMKTASLSP